MPSTEYSQSPSLHTMYTRSLASTVALACVFERTVVLKCCSDNWEIFVAHRVRCPRTYLRRYRPDRLVAPFHLW